MARCSRSRSRDYDRRDTNYDRDDSRDRPRGRGRETDDRQRSRHNDGRDDSRPRQRGRNSDYDDRGRNDDYRSRRRSRSRDYDDDRDRQRSRRDRDRAEDARRDRDRSQDRDRRGQRRESEDEQRRGNASDDEHRSKASHGGERAAQNSKPSDVPDWVRDLVEPTAAQPAAAPVTSGQRFIMIPEQFVSKVLGYQRCIINEIQATTQTSIHMNQNLGKGYTVATITSTLPGAVEKAEAMINARIEAGMKTQAAYTQGYHGMGKGGKAAVASGAMPYSGLQM